MIDLDMKLKELGMLRRFNVFITASSLMVVQILGIIFKDLE